MSVSSGSLNPNTRSGDCANATAASATLPRSISRRLNAWVLFIAQCFFTKYQRVKVKLKLVTGVSIASAENDATLSRLRLVILVVDRRKRH
jgi:hypothetical protein